MLKLNIILNLKENKRGREKARNLMDEKWSKLSKLYFFLLVMGRLRMDL